MLIVAPTDSIVVAPPWPRPCGNTVEALTAQPSSLIGDAQGRRGTFAAAIRPVTPHARLAGTALTIETREGDNLAVHRALDEVRPGDVLVIDAHAYADRAVFGEILALAFQAAGAVGAIVDGAIRDADALAELGFPVYARAISSAGPYKSGPGEIGSTVSCGGVVCQAGDVIVGDRDGLVRVRQAEAAEVLTDVVAQGRIEDELRARILG